MTVMAPPSASLPTYNARCNGVYETERWCSDCGCRPCACEQIARLRSEQDERLEAQCRRLRWQDRGIARVVGDLLR